MRVLPFSYAMRPADVGLGTQFQCCLADARSAPPEFSANDEHVRRLHISTTLRSSHDWTCPRRQPPLTCSSTRC